MKIGDQVIYVEDLTGKNENIYMGTVKTITKHLI